MFSATLLALALNACPIPPPDYVYDSVEVEHDVKRFPCKQVARANMDFANRHIEWLKAWQTIDDSPEVQEWLIEACELQDCWWALHFAWVRPTRACDMDNLRKRIGEENYRLGRMPAPVPMVRFAHRN